MKKRYYHKLIRDKVPVNMAAKGVAFRVRKLTTPEFRRELLKKVGEEASALPRLKKNTDIADELADTLDVIRAIQKTFGITNAQIRNAQKKAMNKKGGFNKRIYLYWSADSDYKTNERTYKR